MNATFSNRPEPQASRRAPSTASRGRQSGSIVINTVIALSLIVVALIGTELGYLFYVKRDLQKAADLAALAGTRGLTPYVCDGAVVAATGNANGSGDTDPARNLPRAFSLQASEVECGRWQADDASDPTGRRFEGGVLPFNAVRIHMQKTPPLLLPAIPGNAPRAIVAEAIAARQAPQAALSIRSTLLNVGATEAGLLNQVLGALLGSSLNLSAAGWNGLVGANIRLLDVLVALGATVGDYESVLDSRISLARLFEVGAGLLERDGHLLEATALGQIRLAALVRDADIRLGDLLGVGVGTPSSALNVDLQVFGLAQSAIQLANGENALASDLTVALPGVLGLSSKIKVIEKPQFSAIGNPELVNPALGTSDPAKIHVRTAQVRTLHSVELTGLTGIVNTLGSTLTGAISPLLNFLGTVGTLNLGNILSHLVGSLVCGGIIPCPEARIVYTQVLPAARIDLSIEGSAGSALVTDHLCEPDSKTLQVQGETSLARVRIGNISEAFSSTEAIQVEPVQLIEIGYTEERYEACFLNLILGSLGCSGRQYKNAAGHFVNTAGHAHRSVIAGIGLRADVPVAGSQTGTALVYAAPAPENLPEIDAPPWDGVGNDPSYQSIQATDIVSSLGDALDGLDITFHQSSGAGPLGSILQGTVSLVNGLVNTLSAVVKTALSPLLDPLLNGVLRFAGIDIAQTEIGARLSCERGATLVY